MVDFSFVHAADLHLGAPFRGLDAAASDVFAGRSGSLGDILAEAGYETLKRLESVCLETGAACLILSGDVYDDADGVLRARFALRDMFARLGEAGVRVFVAHGNHDPWSDKKEPVSWPDNVTVFGPDVSCSLLDRNGAALALVHGISHAGRGVRENLAERFARYTPGSDGARFADLPGNLGADVYQIAVLHCAVGGAAGGHAPYAPCALSDLTGAGFDYWALGHVHQGGILHRDPFVVYPGSVLGLHVNESGPRGCVVARVRGGETAVERVSLAPVVWRKCILDLDGTAAGTSGTPGLAVPGSDPLGPDSPEPDSFGLEWAGGTAVSQMEELEGALLGALERAALDAAEACGRYAPRALFCRMILRGRTALDAVLRKPGNSAALLERIRAEQAQGTAGGMTVWVKDLILETRPERDEAALLARGDLAGEAARLARAAGDDPDIAAALAERALRPLYGHHKLKKILTAGSPGSPDEMLAASGDTVSAACGGAAANAPEVPAVPTVPDDGFGGASVRAASLLAPSAGSLLTSLLEGE